MRSKQSAWIYKYRVGLLVATFALGIGSAVVVFADRDSGSIDALQDIYRTLSERIETSGGVRVEYTVESRMRDTARGVTVENVVAMIGAKRSFLESKHITAARDSVVAVTVVPERRQILVTATRPTTQRDAEAVGSFSDPIRTLREKVLGNCTVIEERDTISPDGVALRRVTIALGGKVPGARFERADLIFNPEKREPCGYRKPCTTTRHLLWCRCSEGLLVRKPADGPCLL